MTNGTTTIEQVEAALAQTGPALEELSAAAADIADVSILLGDDDSALFDRLSTVGQDAASALSVPTFAIAV
jgi:hypothetical protein